MSVRACRPKLFRKSLSKSCFRRPPTRGGEEQNGVGLTSAACRARANNIDLDDECICTQEQRARSRAAGPAVVFLPRVDTRPAGSSAFTLGKLFAYASVTGQYKNNQRCCCQYLSNKSFKSRLSLRSWLAAWRSG